MTTCKDPLTGEEFVPSRRTQRFASRANQILFNNQKAQQKRDAKRQIDRALDTNRAVLTRLLGEAKQATFSKDYLLGAGFSFSAFTQFFSREGRQTYGIYEMRLENLGDNQFRITKAQ